MKQIIERRLSLKQGYDVLGIYYGSLQDNSAICDNCGRVIANHAQIIGHDDFEISTIGLDCLKNFIANNELIGVGKDKIERFERYEPKIKKVLKQIKDLVGEIGISRIQIERKNYVVVFVVSLDNGMNRICHTEFKVSDKDIIDETIENIVSHLEAKNIDCYCI